MDRGKAPSTDTLKEKLDFTRKCTSTGPRDRCWLITELPAWNRALNGLAYELVETRPGRLSLRYVTHGCVQNFRKSAACEAASLLPWLIEHHNGCIDELGLLCVTRPRDTSVMEALVPILLRPPLGQRHIRSIRSLELKMCKTTSDKESSYFYLPDEGLDAVRGLEEIKIRFADDSMEQILLKLLRHNSNSLKCVDVGKSPLSERILVALRCLNHCESLTVSLCSYEFGSHSQLDPVTELARGLVGVKNFKFLPLIRTERNLSAIAEALRTGVTLTTLEIYIHKSDISPRDLFAALAVNTSVQILRIGAFRIDEISGAVLAWSLSQNACLRDLYLSAAVADVCMPRLAEALSRNTTLEKLEFSGPLLRADGVLAMCDALRVNSTLKKLVLPLFIASETERKTLAEKLAHGDNYRRVQLPLAEPDLVALSPRLACPASCPKELTYINICRISDTTLKLFFDALAASRCVHALSVLIGENMQGKSAALCEMLVANRSIRRIDITMHNDNGHFVQELLNALEANEVISELSIMGITLSIETASAFSNFFARNRTVTKFELSFLGTDFSRFLKKLCPGVTMNPVITEFQMTTLSISSYVNCCPPIAETLRRNQSTLNRAIDFVVLRIRNRTCAEAFQLFAGKPCFLARLTKTLGQTEREAVLAISSAENFLLDNFLMITGIVRCSLACYPVDGSTQCDQLNAECWRAIVRRLKIADVLADD